MQMSIRTAPVLEGVALVKEFAVGQRPFRPAKRLRAVDGVDLDLSAGETVGLVGESGCGKSTLASLFAQLLEPTSGRVVIEGENVAQASASRAKEIRRKVQMIFQDPGASMNPRMRIVDVIGEPLENFTRLGAAERRSEAIALLGRVGLPPEAAYRYPHAFSGGQRQRIAIARALAAGPSIIVADEAIAALDLSVRAQVINLLLDLQAESGTAMLFVTHDIAAVGVVSDRIAVMYLGRIVELAPAASLFAEPLHPYSRALLRAAPVPRITARRREVPLMDEVPSITARPAGCHFHPRCPLAIGRCREEVPAFRDVGSRKVACHLV